MSESAVEALKNSPCARKAMLWGIPIGAVVGLHRYRTTKIVRSSGDFAIGAFLLVSAGMGGFCTVEYRTRLNQTRQFMDVMNNPEKKAEAEQFLRSRVQTKEAETEE